MKQEKVPEKETTQPGSNSQLPLYPRSVLDVDMITSSIITSFLNQNTKPDCFSILFNSAPHVSSLGFPFTVTFPFLTGCLNCL